jgi:hypothetical protein
LWNINPVKSDLEFLPRVAISWFFFAVLNAGRENFNIVIVWFACYLLCHFSHVRTAVFVRHIFEVVFAEVASLAQIVVVALIGNSGNSLAGRIGVVTCMRWLTHLRVFTR